MMVTTSALTYTLMSAMAMFNVEHPTFPTYFDAVHWSVISLTTISYGDLYPTTNIERVMAMLSSFIGIAIVAMPSGIIAAGLMEGIGRKAQTTRRVIQGTDKQRQRLEPEPSAKTAIGKPVNSLNCIRRVEA